MIKKNALLEGIIVHRKTGQYPMTNPPYPGLQMLADKLNSEEAGVPPWFQIKAIVENFAGYSDDIDPVRCFNELTRDHSMVLSLRMHKTSDGKFYITPDYTATSDMGSALKALWVFYFSDQGWLRLKKCLHCDLWFVDRSKNKRQLVCSKPCSNRYWSREKRKQSNHKQYQRKED